MKEIDKIRKELVAIHIVRCSIGADYMEYVKRLVDVVDDEELYAFYEQKLRDLEGPTNENKDKVRALTDQLRVLEQEEVGSTATLQ